MNSSRIHAVILLVLSCALGGCSGTEGGCKVSGNIRLDGQPLADAEIRFVPKDDTSLGTHAATTDSEGNFALKADRNIPVRPGAYRVLVNKFAVKERALKGAPPGKGDMVNLVPATYQNGRTTPLKADIQPGVNKLPPFELQSSGKR